MSDHLQKANCPEASVGADKSGQIADHIKFAGTNNIVPLDSFDGKRFATARARAALIGHTLVRVGDGFILGRYTYTKHCADLDAVEALLDRMGAPQ